MRVQPPHTLLTLHPRCSGSLTNMFSKISLFYNIFNYSLSSAQVAADLCLFVTVVPNAVLRPVLLLGSLAHSPLLLKSVCFVSVSVCLHLLSPLPHYPIPSHPKNVPYVQPSAKVNALFAMISVHKRKPNVSFTCCVEQNSHHCHLLLCIFIIYSALFPSKTLPFVVRLNLLNKEP